MRRGAPLCGGVDRGEADAPRGPGMVATWANARQRGAPSSGAGAASVAGRRRLGPVPAPSDVRPEGYRQLVGLFHLLLHQRRGLLDLRRVDLDDQLVVD